MFVWWLIKRAVKPVVGFWVDDSYTQGFNRAMIVLGSFGLTVIIDILGNVLVRGYNKDSEVYWVTSLLPMVFWLCFGAYHLVRHLAKLHTEYRAEQPEKPKRKNDEYIVDSDFLDGYEIDEKEQARQSFEDGYNAAAEFIHGLNLDGE